jgi:hypothetical protein
MNTPYSVILRDLPEGSHEILHFAQDDIRRFVINLKKHFGFFGLLTKL